MWENEHPNSIKDEDKQLKQAKNILSPNTERQGESILLIQLFMCVASIIFVLFVRTFVNSLYINLKTEYKTLMNKGVNLSEQSELVKFANATIADIREEVSRIFSELEEPIIGGGEQKVVNSAVPIDASLQKYQLTDKLFCPANGALTSGFGMRKNPITHKKDFHKGIDIAAKKESCVYSAFTGTVAKTGNDKIRGNYIVIKHSDALQTLYQHLEKISVNENTLVKRGEIIGSVGNTGLSSGYHLHFEIIIKGKSVNPTYAIVLDSL